MQKMNQYDSRLYLNESSKIYKEGRALTEKVEMDNVKMSVKGTRVISSAYSIIRIMEL